MYVSVGKDTKISPKQDTFHENLRFFIKNLCFFLQIPKKVVPLHRIFENALRSQAASRYKASFLRSICTDIAPLIGVWCNGNTADSGPAFPGSSPGTPTKREMFARASLFVVFESVALW